MKPFTRTFVSLATLTALATGPASAGVFGSLANFDAINDTGVIARGFEIELHGITKSEISDVFGLNRNFGTPSPGDVERYGLPTIGDLYDGAGTVIGAKVTYRASFGASGPPEQTFEAQPTPSTPPAKVAGPSAMSATPMSHATTSASARSVHQAAPPTVG